MVESVQHETELSLRNEAAAAQRAEEQGKARARLDQAIQNVRNNPLLSSERRADLLAQLDDLVNASPAAIERALAEVASQLPAATAEGSYEMVGNAGVASAAEERRQAYEYARSECVRIRMQEITEGNIQEFAKTFVEDDGILTQGEQQDIAKTVSKMMQPRIMEINKHSPEVRGAAALAGHTAQEQLKAMQNDPAFEKYHDLLRYITREKVADEPRVAELLYRIRHGEKVDPGEGASLVGEVSIGLILNAGQYRDAVAKQLPAPLRAVLDKELDSGDHITLIERGHEIMLTKGERLKTIKAINEAIAHGQSLDTFTPEQIKDAAAYKYTSFMDAASSIEKYERMNEKVEQLKIAQAKGETLKPWQQSLIDNMAIVNDVNQTMAERVAHYKDLNKKDASFRALMASTDPKQFDDMIAKAITTFDSKGGIGNFKNATAEQRVGVLAEMGIVDSLLAATDSFSKGYEAIQQGNTTEAVKQASNTGTVASKLLEATGLVSTDSAKTVGGLVSETLALTAVSNINAQNVAKNAAAAAAELMKGNFSNALAALDIEGIKAKLAQNDVVVKDMNATHDAAQATSQQAVAANAKVTELPRALIR